ncbi:MAG: alpha/beta hydrolase [Chloroflexi bacterium]|nr:alpha/beta hydrolase [Chloroflexota bacterium]
MTTRHLVDPELIPLLDQLPPLQLSREGLPEMRAARRALLESQRALQPDFPEIEVIERNLPGQEVAPGVRVLLYQPRTGSRPAPALLWIHGGGYVLGSPDADDVLVKTVVAQVGCAAVSVDYRLAPETPFPGPLEDCYVALSWLHTHAADLGVRQDRIAIGGSSAGGGLTAALGLLARDRGEVPIAFQLLLVPMLDDRTATTTTHDPHPHTGEFMWTAASNLFGWSALLGYAPASDNVSPYAAPARAESLAGLPPTFIGVGSLDLFVEEDIEYARRLMRAGVPTELHVYPGAYHGFSQVADARVSQAYIRDYTQALERALCRADV